MLVTIGARQSLIEPAYSMLVMYHVQALSYEDISDALDLPIGTVKSRLNRARLALRDRLAQDVELFNVS